MKTFKATNESVKKLGRTHEYRDALWLTLSGSGAEFSFYGTKAEIVLKSDDMAGGVNPARIGILVNGERVVDERLDRPVKTYTVFESAAAEQVAVTVIKLSEAAMSTVGIAEIRVEAERGIQPTPQKNRRIEFIGDSITCGYGVDDEYERHSFSTATEDVTQAYAYRTAEALQADYSMVSYSGYGIISGYTENDARLLTHLVPDYYEQLAKSEGKLDGKLDPLSIDWDFARFAPDLIVINLGTNDDSYTSDHADRQAEFGRRYVDFLKTIRRRNAEARILCTLGMMGDRLYPVVEQAVRDYTAQTGDSGVSAMKFDEQRAEDGYAADYHPSRRTHAKAADRLTRHIEQLWG
ncbi:GDSL-type esterase/lipase family protein [Saccharibacillus sp. CPCC 101409]|uniref:SGNH/GDSL hydrolase family protein n=1 Tax=Saccharibacillus sp. CPCC 101409 TaxID=3058041 RepID=UPI0026732C62|nr:SGNH/GDSL hydrolase family protein [Saccharibacillus sp. CPCC 101409]MDO3412756.1 GDSL-type esterase/lipase family protein [Saccharibacillus sp. CPCC 101409]